MKELATYLLAIAFVLAAAVLAVNLIDPPKPVLLIDAAMPSDQFRLDFVTHAELCPADPVPKAKPISHT
jgi:hypothetical protein